jgi:hypothetical protein
MNIYQKLIIQFINKIKINAVKSKKKLEQSNRKNKQYYYEGQVLAYYEILSHLKNQLISFQIPFNQVNFNFNPDELLSKGSLNNTPLMGESVEIRTYDFLLSDYITDIITEYKKIQKEKTTRDFFQSGKSIVYQVSVLELKKMVFRNIHLKRKYFHLFDSLKMRTEVRP